jgi:hypothetical protein
VIRSSFEVSSRRDDGETRSHACNRMIDMAKKAKKAKAKNKKKKNNPLPGKKKKPFEF